MIVYVLFLYLHLKTLDIDDKTPYTTLRIQDYFHSVQCYRR